MTKRKRKRTTREDLDALSAEIAERLFVPHPQFSSLQQFLYYSNVLAEKHEIVTTGRVVKELPKPEEPQP